LEDFQSATQLLCLKPRPVQSSFFDLILDSTTFAGWVSFGI